jgi:threonine dehydrogenase-like Zn-dependent dehydrogenase
MGLLMLQLLARSGQAALVAIDPRPDAPRAAAFRHRADLCLDPSEMPRDFTVDDADTDPSRGSDVVVEATGAQAAPSLATALIPPYGVPCILGCHQAARMVDMRLLNFKALDAVNGHIRDRQLLRRSIERGLKLLSTGRVRLASLVDGSIQAVASRRRVHGIARQAGGLSQGSHPLT